MAQKDLYQLELSAYKIISKGDLVLNTVGQFPAHRGFVSMEIHLSFLLI